MSEYLPDAVDAAAIESTRQITEEAPKDDVYALVSGGHDSLTAMHVAFQSPSVDLAGVIHINTGIGVPETRVFVEQRAHDLGLEFHEVGAPHDGPTKGSEYRLWNEEYANLVREYGFPGPGAHKWMYVNLKEKPLQRFLRDDRTPDPAALISGVRKHESDRRKMNVDTAGVGEYLGHRTLSPIANWTGLDVRRYRRALDLPMNPVVEQLEMSGECLCGAYADRGEMRMLRLFYPKVYRRLTCLEATVSAASQTDAGPSQEYRKWGHNRLKDRERDALEDDSQMLLCATCEQQATCDSNGGDC